MKKCENKNSTFHYLKIFLKCTGRERLVISFCYYSHRGSFGKTRSTFSSIHKTNRREGIFSRAEGSTTIVPILTKHQYQQCTLSDALSFIYGKCTYLFFKKNQGRYATNIYLFKVKNRNSRKRCEICSILTIKTHLFVVSLLLTLNKLFLCFFNPCVTSVTLTQLVNRPANMLLLVTML